MAPNPNTSRTLSIDMEPIGKRAQVLRGKTTLDATCESGIKSFHYVGVKVGAKVASSELKVGNVSPYRG